MSRRSFSFCVLRYVHDPVAAESMNVGVVVYSAEAKFLDTALMYSYRRLSEAFAGFDAEGYRRALRSLHEQVARIRDEMFSPNLSPANFPPDAVSVMRSLWPDQQLGLRIGDASSGFSEDLTVTTHQLFDRFIDSQYSRSYEERRTDEQVWQSYAEKLRGTALPKVLQPVSFSTENLSAEFMGFKNERWHLMQPISLDYARESSIARKAKEFLGEFVELADNEEVRKGRLYLLLGAPTHANYQNAYRHAKDMLKKIPFDASIIEEADAAAFAVTMDEFVRAHVNLPDERPS